MSWVWRYGVLAMLLGLMGYVEMSRSPRTNEDSPPGKNETTEWNETTRAVSHGGPEALGLEHLKEAFEEQGYYLERLFLQYGENGTLSYGGLQQLLGSLGLGGVSVLQISHHGLKPAPPTPQHAPPSGQHPNSPPLPLPHMDSRQEGAASVDTTETHHRQTNGRAGAGHGKQPLAPHPPPGKTQPSPGMDHPIQTHFHGNCLNVTQLLWNFGLGKTPHITPAHFTFLCPALLYQIDSGVCLRHAEGEGLETGREESFLIALGWGSLALTVISLPSLLALGLVPLLRPSYLQALLCPMAGLAVGTLCGDALLHLLPHASAGSHSHSQQRDSVLKGASVLGGLYLLFLFESALGLRHQHKRKVKRERQESASPEHTGGTEGELTTLQGETSPDEVRPSQRPHAAELGHGHSHDPPGEGHSGMGSLVWMVVMGDGIHNLTDGLAIGAAFSQGLAGGLSTTVAVFCHELPHELGDLAVLLGLGWPIRRLLVFSGVSAALGFLGLLAGTVLGHHSAALSPWILALTAGVFLYVALADMMPEMLHAAPQQMGALTRFLLQNLGLLTGGAIMLCIALFEENIAFNLRDA